MRNSLIFMVIVFLFILSGCAKTQSHSQPNDAVQPKIVMPVTYEHTNVSDNYFEAKMLVCQKKKNDYKIPDDVTVTSHLLNFSTYDNTTNCYWQRNILREEDLYVSDIDCQKSNCYFFNLENSQTVRLVVYVPSMNATFLSNEIKLKIDGKYVMNLASNGSAEININ